MRHGYPAGAPPNPRMKPTALFVNVSRGALVGDEVLAEALAKGRPGRAAVDVYEGEPIVDGKNPLVKLDSCLCTPHIGFVERDTYERYLGGAFQRIVAFAAGKPIEIVNPEALGAGFVTVSRGHDPRE